MSAQEKLEVADHEGGQLITESDNMSENSIIKSILEIEHQKIAVADGRNQVILKSVEFEEDANKREFEISIKRLETEDKHRTNAHNLAKYLCIGGSISIVIIMFLLLYFTFSGTASQSEYAIMALKILAIGGGGYGIVSAIGNALKQVLQTKK